jgi:diadenosine tetraphosphate (Ap4A) HIT family hydrolase
LSTDQPCPFCHPDPDLVFFETELVLGREAIAKHHSPDGFNIGINSGEAAGQTVFHLHVHLIPRFEGDREDPRGGVRHVMPDKANYWEE